MTRLRIPLLALLLVFACAQMPTLRELIHQRFDKFDALVADHVTDEAGKAQTHAVVDRLRAVWEQFYSDVGDVGEEFARTSRNYDATRQELGALLEHLQANRIRARDQIIDLVLEARQSVTAAEWDAIHSELRQAGGQ